VHPQEKTFKIPGSEIRKLIPSETGCFATDRITVDGVQVGYMYREEPDFGGDSGWRFFAGDESQEYVDNADNLAIYRVNTICNYDPAIIPYLGAEIGCAFGRILGTDQFEAEKLVDVEPANPTRE
jgi:hypothetical protein